MLGVEGLPQLREAVEGSFWPRTSESARRIAQSSFASPGGKTARFVAWGRPSMLT